MLLHRQKSLYRTLAVGVDNHMLRTALIYCCEFLLQCIYFLRTFACLSWLQWTLDDLKFSLTSRIFWATVSFLSPQLQHKMFVKSEPLLLYIYLLSGDQFNIQTSFVLFLATQYHQFLFKIFVHNHFSTELTNLICSFDARETHIQLFWLEWNRYFLPFNFQMSSDQLQVMPLLIFVTKCKWNPSSKTSTTTFSLARSLHDLNNDHFVA